MIKTDWSCTLCLRDTITDPDFTVNRFIERPFYSIGLGYYAQDKSDMHFNIYVYKNAKLTFFVSKEGEQFYMIFLTLFNY